MYKFIKTQGSKTRPNRTGVLVEIPEDHLTIEDLLVEFKGFLQACGFEIDGELMVVKPDKISDQDV